MKKTLMGITLLMLILAACASQSQPTEQSLLPNDELGGSYPNGTTYPNGGSYPSDSNANWTPAQQAAITALSQTLNLPPGQITLISTEAAEWPDGCLGIQKPGMFCTQAIVPGYKIILQAGGDVYEFRTNKDGSQVARATDTISFASVEEKIVNQLAGNLGLDPSEVTLVSSSDKDFGDTCLDVPLPEVQCAQVLMPGKLIVVSANDVKYEYHASKDGTFIQPASLALTWKREGGIAGFCDSLIIFRSGEISGNQCQSQPGNATGSFAGLLTSDEIDQFDAWLTKLGSTSIDASNPVGVSDRMVVTLEFYGHGKGSPSDAEKQDLLSWAQTVFQKLYN